MSTFNDVLAWATNRGRGLPAKAADEADVLLRADDVGNVQVQTQHRKHHALARTGNYFVFQNATPGTGIASIAAADGPIDDLETFMHLVNQYTAAQGKWIQLDYIRCQTTVAGDGSTSNWCMKIEPTPSSTRLTSGGNTYLGVAANNVNPQSTTVPSCTLSVGALITTAASSRVRILTGCLARPCRTIVGDQFLFVFGGAQPELGQHIMETAAIANVVIPCPPVVLGPTDEFLLHWGATSQGNAASFEFEVGLWVE